MIADIELYGAYINALVRVGDMEHAERMYSRVMSNMGGKGNKMGNMGNMGNSGNMGHNMGHNMTNMTNMGHMSNINMSNINMNMSNMGHNMSNMTNMGRKSNININMANMSHKSINPVMVDVRMRMLMAMGDNGVAVRVFDSAIRGMRKAMEMEGMRKRRFISIY